MPLVLSESDAQGIGGQRQEIQPTASLIYAMAALVIYDYFITFAQEFAFVWKRKWNLTTWLLVANRYLLIASVIFNVIVSLLGSNQSCPVRFDLGRILTVASFLPIAFFSALRVFAIWDRRSVPETVIVFVLNLVPLGTTIYAYTRGMDRSAVNLSSGRVCGLTSKIPPAGHLSLILGTHVPVIAANILVLTVTWSKKFRSGGMADLRINMQLPLCSLFLRDGTIYFVTFLLMEIAQVLVETMPSSPSLLPVKIVTTTFPAMLMSRFLFNLREIGAQTEYSAGAPHDSSSSSRLPTLIIFRVVDAVGNIGEVLDHCGFDQGTDDEVDYTETDSSQMDDTLPAKYGYTHNSGIPAQIERRGKWRGRRDD